MKRWTGTGWLAVWLGAAVGAAAADSDLPALEGVVGRWLDLRAAMAEEQQAWQTQRSQWEEEIHLLEQENKTLRREIDSGSEFVSSEDERNAAVLARQEVLTEGRARLRAVADRAEARLKRWEQWIPDGLRQPLEGSFRALPETQADADALPLIRRLQAIVSLQSQIESLQNGFHATREIIGTGGEDRRLMDVLYVGLARGYAVSPGDDWAAVGVPSEDGWVWTPCADQAASIRRALEILDREKVAEMAELPVQWPEGSTP